MMCKIKLLKSLGRRAMVERKVWVLLPKRRVKGERT